MASRASEEASGQSHSRRAVPSRPANHRSSRLSYPEAKPTEWQLYAQDLEQEISVAHDDIRYLEGKLARTRLDFERHLDRYPHFDPQTHQIVSRTYLAQVGELQMELKSLKKAVNEKTSAHDSVVSLWQNTLQELEEAKSSKKSLVIDDDVMTSKWKQLQYIIKNLSSLYLYGLATSTADRITPDDLERYGILMPDFITTKILAVPMIVWGQTLADSARNLMGTIMYGNNVSESDFHAFRAQTGEIMHNATNIDRTTCDSLKTELKVQVQAFISPENTEEVTRQLNTIIDKAVELAVIFNQSRCFYHLRVMSRGRKRLFDANTMDKIGDGDSPYVYSVISPIFSKYGNSRGENYGEGIVLAKAAVLC